MEIMGAEGESMSIKSIKVLNVMAFQRQWRKNNEDCNTFNAEPGDVISDTFELQFCGRFLTGSAGIT